MRICLQQFKEETTDTVEISEVLSDIQIELDGGTHNPAVWHEWLTTVVRALDDSSSATE
jgi:hypothetical protein